MKSTPKFITPVCIDINNEDLCEYLETLGYLKSSTYDPLQKTLWTSGE